MPEDEFRSEMARIVWERYKRYIWEKKLPEQYKRELDFQKKMEELNYHANQ